MEKLKSKTTTSAELRNICKSFGGRLVNSDLSFKIQPGEVHALLGENGAGKSTAMKILFGMLPFESGEILINGEKIDPAKWNPKEAFKAGIGMVHQHFMLARSETVLDNLVLGVEERRLYFFRNRQSERLRITTLMRDTGLSLPLDEKLGNLTIGMQSRCEILKVLYRDAKLLILDEPTAVLTPQEIEDFLAILKKLKTKQIAVLLITHKLHEIMQIADRATVLRGGKMVGTVNIADTTPQGLAEMMIGRALQLPSVETKINHTNKPYQFKWNNSEVLQIFPGEILGIAGVEGNGQEQLIKDVSKKFPRAKLGYIPGDRLLNGLIHTFNLTENLRLGRAQIAKNGFQIFENFSESENLKLHEYNVQPLNPKLNAGDLSGGNQQKLIAAREIPDEKESDGLEQIPLLIAHHPTRGIDIGSIEIIHQKILHFARSGGSVLLISSELEELTQLSHRIGAIYKNKITNFFEGPNYNLQTIGEAMLGISLD